MRSSSGLGLGVCSAAVSGWADSEAGAVSASPAAVKMPKTGSVSEIVRIIPVR